MSTGQWWTPAPPGEETNSVFCAEEGLRRDAEGRSERVPVGTPAVFHSTSLKPLVPLWNFQVITHKQRTSPISLSAKNPKTLIYLTVQLRRNF